MEAKYVEERKEKESRVEARDYKAVCVHKQTRVAWFQENETLVEWVNSQPLEQLLTCIGDGHSGIWKLMRQFNPWGKTREILDWFHLVENLYKVGGSNQRIYQAKKLLWQGKVDVISVMPNNSGVWRIL